MKLKRIKHYVGVLPMLALSAWVVFGSVFVVSCNDRGTHNEAFYDTLLQKDKVEYIATGARRPVADADSLFARAGTTFVGFMLAYYDLKSLYYYDHHNPDTASWYMDSTINFLEGNDLTRKYPVEYLRALNARGDYYFLDNDLDKAFQCYYKCRMVHMTIKPDTCAMGNHSYHLGMVTYRQEKYKESAEYFKQSFREIGQCVYDSGVYFRQQEELSNIGLAYTKINELDSAILYYKRALALIDTQGRKYNYSTRYKYLSEVAQGVVLGNFSKVYIALHKDDTAEQILLRSIAINGRPGYENYDAMYANMQLAELYHSSGQINKLPVVLSNLKLALDTMANPSVNLRWHNLMYQYNKEMGKPAEALVYFEKYLKLKDSSEAGFQRLKKTDYGMLLKDQETQFQLKLLRKDNQLNRLYLVVTIGLAVIALIIIGFVYYNYFRSRRNVVALTSLNRKVNDQKEELEQTMQQLENSNEDKDRILRIVAHDLRTPINGIMMISEYLLEEETNAEKMESLKMIMSASGNLVHLTNELLEFSGNKSQADLGVKQDIDLNELAKQTVGLLQFKASEKKQNIELILAPEWMMVSVYKEKIARVLSNLVSNAIKFSEQNALIKVKLEKKGNTALISVADNGIGIPNESLPFVFDSFTSAKRHGTAGETSYGLGLSICKQIIVTHNGRIWVESTEGTGSTFFIELPL